MELLYFSRFVLYTVQSSLMKLTPGLSKDLISFLAHCVEYTAYNLGVNSTLGQILLVRPDIFALQIFFWWNWPLLYGQFHQNFITNFL